ncbi:MAG: 4Fe-4S ferredoxin [Magnetovibrio sp.]|nr:4Fe-4S ferredoxin [Magnetovibrio sp.]
MKINDIDVLVCNCEGTMAFDNKSLTKLCDGETKNVSQLCRSQLEIFEETAKASDRLLVACTQEAPLFLDAAKGLGANEPELRFCNIREKAGWCAEKPGKASTNLTAKMAALLNEATLDIPETQSISMESSGSLLIIGPADMAIEAAYKIDGWLDVTILVIGPHDAMPPRIMSIPVFHGHIASATGHLGAFQINVNEFQAASPSVRSSIAFTDTSQSGKLECDLILDVRGETPLFTAPEKRDGYFNPDPGNPTAISDALLKLVDLVGTFDKPRYVNYDPAICAYGNSGIIGCTKCIDSCPTGAITPDNDKLSYDPFVCAGCGTCASVCPTGAAKYTLPAGDSLYMRLRALISSYREAGGENPQLLIHDASWGEDMLAVMARSGKGLPSNMMPFSLNSVAQVGLEFLLTAYAYGTENIVLVTDPARFDEMNTVKIEAKLANTVLAGLGYGNNRGEVLDYSDPDALQEHLYALPVSSGLPTNNYLAMGRKRSVLGQALKALYESAPDPVDTIALEPGAPFGAVNIDTDGCTLCLSCVGACPTGALKDNPDQPELSFSETLCVQCGLCRNTCPESVIELEPRLSFKDAALTHQIVKTEKPFECIRCGKEFGTQSTIENMIKKLEGHPLFTAAGGTDRLKMCEDCRVIAIATEDKQPLALGKVPVTRTTEDYLREREELRKEANIAMKEKGLKPDDSS